ncbi:hypothetical protein AXF24_12395 [Streptococcus pneumoniae]|nr:hypothetical protein AWW74_12410 [Streptococcus pneumoniae]KXB94840.1 hypothetical protein AXF24_12395 [Streptococcus pneumoniae]
MVILGQDPYHGEGQACGLCFSVKDGTPLPPSLKNIYKEIESDCGVKKDFSNGNLEEWAKQGVFLLNSVLSVVADSPAIQVGDIVFDENGDDCTVIKKHKGGSERFYDIYFSNGQVVRAGGNHLWNVYNLNEIPVYNAKSNLIPVFTDSEIDEFTRIGVSSDELSKISRDDLLDIAETLRTRTALALWLDNHFTGSPSTITGHNPQMMLRSARPS